MLRLYDPFEGGRWLLWCQDLYSAVEQPAGVLPDGLSCHDREAERPSYERRIPVLRDDENNGFSAIDHHGDSTGGDSGGPFWSFWPNGYSPMRWAPSAVAMS